MDSTHLEEDKIDHETVDSPPTSRLENLNHDQCPVPAETGTHLQRLRTRHRLGSETWVEETTDDRVTDRHMSANGTSMAKVVTTTRRTEDVIVTPSGEENINPREILRDTETTKIITVGPTTTMKAIRVDLMKLETSTTEGHQLDRHGGNEDHQLKDHNPADQHLNDMLPRKQITV